MSQSTNLPYHYPVRVYYEDTDVGQVVYHANYIKYLERGRTEWLRSLGFDQSVLMEQNVAFAVVNINIDYIKPARFNDLLTIHTDIQRVGRASIQFLQSIYLQNGAAPLSCEAGTLLCKAEVKVACVKMPAIKTTPLPIELRQLLVKK